MARHVVLATFSSYVWPPAVRATAGRIGRTDLSAQAHAKNSYMGLLRPEDPSGTADPIRRHS